MVRDLLAEKNRQLAEQQTLLFHAMASLMIVLREDREPTADEIEFV